MTNKHEKNTFALASWSWYKRLNCSTHWQLSFFGVDLGFFFPEQQAKERRDGQNKDYEQTEMISTTADYRAVAPDAKS